MLLTEKEARTLCDQLLNFVKADDAIVTVGGEIESHLRFAANSFTLSVRSRQMPAAPGTLAWPPRRPSIPTSRATVVT